MRLQRKTMSRSEWPGAFERNVRTVRMPFGDVGLISYRNVTHPTIKNSVTIIGNGIEWLQLAPRGESWFMTAMFENGILTQYYFDIADELFFDEEASFTDLFLDVLLIPGRDALVLDMDELIAAERDGSISHRQAEKALATAQRLIDRLKTQQDELQRFCEIYRNKLLSGA